MYSSKRFFLHRTQKFLGEKEMRAMWGRGKNTKSHYRYLKNNRAAVTIYQFLRCVYLSIFFHRKVFRGGLFGAVVLSICRERQQNTHTCDSSTTEATPRRKKTIFFFFVSSSLSVRPKSLNLYSASGIWTQCIRECVHTTNVNQSVNQHHAKMWNEFNFCQRSAGRIFVSSPKRWRQKINI